MRRSEPFIVLGGAVLLVVGVGLFDGENPAFGVRIDPNGDEQVGWLQGAWASVFGFEVGYEEHTPEELAEIERRMLEDQRLADEARELRAASSRNRLSPEEEIAQIRAEGRAALAAFDSMHSEFKRNQRDQLRRQAVSVRTYTSQGVIVTAYTMPDGRVVICGDNTLPGTTQHCD